MSYSTTERAFPECIASTNSTTYPTSVSKSPQQQRAVSDSSTLASADSHLQCRKGSNFFKSAQWSSDGTTILTSSEDNKFRTFVLPTDLLEPSEEPHPLTSYCASVAPEPAYASCLYPYFNLQDSRTTIHLSSPRDHPISLLSTIFPSDGKVNPKLSSYPLIHAPTETYLTPHSLIFTASGTHFLAGSDSLISLFDISRTGGPPVTQLPTIPSKRKKLVGGGVGMKGIVSALASSNSLSAGDEQQTASILLAAGTFTRHVGLYDAEGSGGCVSLFSVSGDGSSARDEDHSSSRGSGAGITQLSWSNCSRYLFVSERKSDCVIVYDIRVAGKRLGRLTGRNAQTNQRLGVSIFHTQDGGDEVWAGGVDGVVRVWKHAIEVEGESKPDWEWKAHDEKAKPPFATESFRIVAYKVIELQQQ
ncbi:MAG: hypothetical protein M4579_001307 [Chaenotheca gracillima]|nr:MAG: hypothetical protein M4579_001307 [Chaenotheca gracillima]